MRAKKHRALYWKEGRVFSIQLRDGSLCLAQMAKAPDLIFFNLFRPENVWDDVQLTEDKVLFCHAVTRQFLSYATVQVVNDIAPLENFDLPTLAIFPNFGSSYRDVTVAGKRRRVIIPAGSYCLAERDMKDHLKNMLRGLFHSLLIPEIKPEDWDKIAGVEDTSVEIYPNLNKRLYLCSKLGKNVNPQLEIDLGMPIPDDYALYVDMISGQITLEEAGY